MKLVSRKTKKAIEKSVRRAMKRQGPALVAAVASSLATLGATEAPGKPGKSNLKDMAERAKKAVAGDDEKAGSRQVRRGRHAQPPAELEDDTESMHDEETVRTRLT